MKKYPFKNVFNVWLTVVLLCLLGAIMSMSSCVEPPRVMVELEDGIIIPVKRPSYDFPDTIIVRITEYKKNNTAVAHIVGVYRDTLPMNTTTEIQTISYHRGIVYKN